MASRTILNKTVCIVGLGYVGLPLAQDFSEHIRTIGYRRDRKKVDELNATPGNRIEATTDPSRIKEADFVIIAVPTPVTKAKDPDPVLVVKPALHEDGKYRFAFLFDLLLDHLGDQEERDRRDPCRCLRTVRAGRDAPPPGHLPR